LARSHRCRTRAPNCGIAEIAYGIERIRPEERAKRLEAGLAEWRRRYVDRIYGLTEEAALATAPSRLATRNTKDFAHTGLELISPWDF
jgi:hypothetical protein